MISLIKYTLHLVEKNKYLLWLIKLALEEFTTIDGYQVKVQ